jgi:hypothetical protein
MYQRGKLFYADWYEDGKRHSKAFTTAKAAKACEAEAKYGELARKLAAAGQSPESCGSSSKKRSAKTSTPTQSPRQKRSLPLPVAGRRKQSPSKKSSLRSSSAAPEGSRRTRAIRG